MNRRQDSRRRSDRALVDQIRATQLEYRLKLSDLVDAIERLEATVRQRDSIISQLRLELQRRAS